LKYFSTYFSSKAIIAYFSVMMICAWLFVPRFLPFIWILFGVISVFTFFYFSSVLTARWTKISSERFQKNIFFTSLVIRLAYVILIYFFYKAKTGIPFEFDVGDAQGYHITATWMVDLFYHGALKVYFRDFMQGVSDSGWEMTMALIYLISFNSILMVRLLNAFASAWMVVLLYKISQRNFGEDAARITGVMAILLPSFIYFSGLHLKETFMIFLLMSFMNQADALLNSKRFTLKNILKVVFFGISLFFFRTALGLAAWFALFSAFLLSSEKLMSQYNRIVIVSWLTIAAAVIFSGTILGEVKSIAEKRKIQQESHLEWFSTREGANKFAKYGSAAVFIPIILFAPFPTLVNIPEQQNLMMTNGDIFTRNIYVFFVVVAFYVLFKRKRLRANLLLSVFLFSYLLILANSGFALSPRFHVPALPFLLLFAGYGITQMNRNFASYYFLYIIGISIVVIAWNWFKLAGRGIV
jgi:hypothetical protein